MNRLVSLAAVVLGGWLAAGCVCAPDYHTDSGYAPKAEFGPLIDQCETRQPCEPLCAAKFDLEIGQIDKCVLGKFDASGAIVTVHFHEDGVCGSDGGGGYYDDDGDWVDDGADDGSSDDGSTDDGGTDTGSDDGSTDDGSTDDGSTDDGGTDDGGTDDGGTDDGGTDDGGDDGDDWKRGAAHAPAHRHAPRSVVR